MIWAGHGSLPGTDGWVSLHLADQAPLTLPEPAAFEHSGAAPGGPRRARARRRLVLPAARPGRRRTHRRRAGRRPLGPGVGRPGRQRHPGAAPLRSISSGRGSHRSRRPGPRGGAQRPTPHRRPLGAAARRSTPTRPGAPTRRPSGCSTGTASSPAARCRARGRPAGSPPSTRCSPRSRTPAAAAAATSSPGSAPPSSAPPGPSTGSVRSPRPAPTTSRSPPRSPRPTRPTRYGAALPWPAASGPATETGHRPGRKAGALVVLVDGELTLYVERGGRTLLTWSDDARPAHARRRRARDRRPPRPARPADRREGRRLRSCSAPDRRPLREALAAAGFVATPRGLRLRA